MRKARLLALSSATPPFPAPATVTVRRAVSVEVIGSGSGEELRCLTRTPWAGECLTRPIWTYRSLPATPMPSSSIAVMRSLTGLVLMAASPR